MADWEQMMAQETGSELMEREILRYVREHDECTFPELIGGVEAAGVKCRGEYCIQYSDYGEVYFWGGASEAFVNAIALLKQERMITLKPIPAMLHVLAGGGGMGLPKAAPGRTYKRPRWLPVVLKASVEMQEAQL
jgi:hypothetical protein